MRGPLRSEVQRASRLWKKAMPPLKQEEEEFLLELAERVREVRAESGITQEKFYEDTNIHIARIEAGKSNISINTLCRICSYFKVSVKDFFGKIKKN
ncbi:MAG TPA: helix-turn-helix transcriptional regulator [Anseongella sp.]